MAKNGNADPRVLFESLAEANDKKPLCRILTLHELTMPWFTTVGLPMIKTDRNSVGYYFNVILRIAKIHLKSLKFLVFDQ